MDGNRENNWYDDEITQAILHKKYLHENENTFDDLINRVSSIYSEDIREEVKEAGIDEEEFLLETNMGYLAIKGSSLEIVRLDTKDGVLSIKGNVDSLSYFDSLKKNSKT